MSRTERPERLSIRDEAGRERTLAAGKDAFAVSGQGTEPFFLGLGPDPAVAAACLPPGREAAYLECPAFAAAMPPPWQAAIPTQFQALAPEDLTPGRIARSRFYLYRQNLRLFPSFWGALWARIQLALLPAPPARPDGAGPVLLVRTAGGLLEPELARGLTALGRTVTALPAENTVTVLREILAREAPALFLCVNGAGLDADGLCPALLAAAGVRLAVWFVDNPFHVLGRFRAPFWKKAHLFVTDDWFVPKLRELGADSVHHLPLAASRHFFTARPASDPAGQALFVGRSAFPGRDAFFAGCQPPKPLLETARTMLAHGERPDFGWWAHQLGSPRLWPGKAVRRVGCGAEMAGLSWRSACLAALAETLPLALYGDAGWRELLPAAQLHGPVEYYAGLAALYAGAAVTVNLTSLLLPHGLSQRHFDVWAAGGMLLSDATPGLHLFPDALTRPMTFRHPGEIADRARDLAGNARLRAELTAGWRELIAGEHTYERRLARLLDVVLGADHS